MGKASRPYVYQLISKVEGYKIKLAWTHFFQSDLPTAESFITERETADVSRRGYHITGGELVAVFKRGLTKYTLRRSLGYEPFEESTIHRGPVSEPLLTREKLEHLLKCAIQMFQSQCRCRSGGITRDAKSGHCFKKGDIEALTLYLEPAAFVVKE